MGFLTMYTFEAWFNLNVLGIYLGSIYGNVKECISVFPKLDGALGEIKLYFRDLGICRPGPGNHEINRYGI